MHVLRLNYININTLNHCIKQLTCCYKAFCKTFICYSYGEVVPLGPNYLPSYAGGVLAGIKELGPKLIGKDPTQLKVINRFMDYELKGHPYVKSPIDMACWDILGKV